MQSIRRLWCPLGSLARPNSLNHKWLHILLSEMLGLERSSRCIDWNLLLVYELRCFPIFFAMKSTLSSFPSLNVVRCPRQKDRNQHHWKYVAEMWQRKIVFCYISLSNLVWTKGFDTIIFCFPGVFEFGKWESSDNFAPEMKSRV